MAEAISFAAEHPKRDMFVGFQAKLLAALAGIFPCLTDKLMEVYAFPSQQSDRPSRDVANNIHPARLICPQSLEQQKFRLFRTNLTLLQ